MLNLRPEVAAFAALMEQRLRENDHKPGWKEDDPRELYERLDEEAGELDYALAIRDGIAKEAADVANFAMMIADVCGVLPHPVAQPNRENLGRAAYAAWLNHLIKIGVTPRHLTDFDAISLDNQECWCSVGEAAATPFVAVLSNLARRLDQGGPIGEELEAARRALEVYQ